MRFVLFSGFFCLCLFWIAFLYAAEAPRYLVHRTGNLVLYFSRDLEPGLIPYFIERTELAERFLASLYGWKADRRIPIVFDREFDDANGWSQVYQKDAIRLLIYPPEEFSVLANHRDYVLNLIVHELTHSLQIGLVSGVPKWINYLFGNLFYPAQLSPGWLLEGAAVYSESAIDGTGRLHFPLWRSWFDSFFQKGTVLSLSEISGSTDHWMRGHLPYLYGTFFYDFLMRRHRSEALAAFFAAMSDNVVPYLDEVEAKKTFGEYFWQAYRAFLSERREHLFAQPRPAQEPQEIGSRFTEVVVDMGRNDRYVYMGSRQGTRAVYAFDGRAEERLFIPSDARQFAVGADGRYLFTIPLRSDQDRMRTTLVSVDAARGEIRRIGAGESATYPFFLPDGIGCFTVTDGRVTLRLYTPDGVERRAYPLPMLDTAHTPSLDPTGSRLIFTGNLRGATKDIFILDLDHGSLERLALPGNQYSASFMKDGRILFSSDEGNRIIPFLFDPATGELFRLFDPLFMALYPRVIGDRLFFIGFDNDGYYPASIMFRPEFFGETTDRFEPITVAADTEPSLSLDQASGWEGMWPTVLVPDYRASLRMQKIGATILGEGDTERRGYSLYFGKTFDASDRYEARLQYYDRDLMPGFRWQASYFWYRGTYGDPEVRIYPGTLQEFETNASTALHFTTLCPIGATRLYRLTHSLSASVGIHVRNETVFNDVTDPTIFPYAAHDGYSLRLGGSYNLFFDFSPGSYLIFSEMDHSAVRLPFSFSRDIHNGTTLLTLRPSLTYSYLFGSAGKAGIVSRHQFYSAFLRDARFTIGGEETAVDLANIDYFLYGFTHSVTVRGYTSEALAAAHLYFSNTELRYHVLAIEQGLGLVPLMVRNLQGALFFDVGAALADPDPKKERFIAGAGTELKLLTYWWYRVPLMFTLGVAHGLTGKGGLSLYFSMGNSF